MSIDTFKAQAHRLQGYLRSNPAAAALLPEGKQSACFAAVAALHGARNWNTLVASAQAPGSVHPATGAAIASSGPEQLLGLPEAPYALPTARDRAAPPDLPPLERLGEVRSGRTVSYVAGIGNLELSKLLVQALDDGYDVTTVSCEPTFQHLALAMGGVAGTVETCSTRDVSGSSFLAVEFRGHACQPVPGHAIPDSGALASTQRLIELVQARQGRGQVLVLQDVRRLLGLGLGAAIQEPLHAFVAAGGSLVLTARALAELESVAGLPVATSVLQGPRRH